MHHFGEKLGVTLTFPRIARLLSCETDADLQSLTTLLVKLLNKMHHRSQLNRWQPALGRFLQRQAYNCDELREIGDALNNGGPPTLFFSLPLEKRLRVLLFCLETQFQLNAPFKEKIKSIDTPILRSPPLGIDIFGNSYWLLVDNECHFLLYRSEAVDMTLELLADTFPALESVLADLKDEKYENATVSELYTPFRGSIPKPEPVSESVKVPLPQLKPPPSPEKIKVDEIKAASPAKQEVSDQPVEQKPIETEVKELTEKPDTGADKCKDAPAEEQQRPDKPPAAESIATTEEAQVLETPQKQEQTEESMREETLGLRRSGRKRKPVEFLKIETFSSKYRSKKLAQTSHQPVKEQKKEKKPKKEKSHKGKSSKKRRRNKKKKSRNGHNENGACLWTRSPEDSEESENDEEGDLWEETAEVLGENSDSSLPENEKHLPHDWLEDIESDFDEDGEGGNEDVVTGRNLQRRQNAEVLDEAPCQICTISNHPEWLLLCDSCDMGYHAQCLRPALHYIPPGDWFCPRCLHARLVTALSEQLESLKVKSKKLDSAARMQERLNFVNISVSNILRDERTKQLNESFSASSSSSEDEEEEENGSGRPRRKHPRYYESDVSTSTSISGSEESESESEEDEEEEEEEEEVMPVRSTRHKNIHYDVDAAFQQLDEVLVEDEKYALEKMERSKAKSIHTEEEQDDVPSERPPLPPFITRKVKKRALSSSSSSKSDASDSEGGRRKRRRRRPSPGSEEFRPSNESVTDEEDSEFGEVPEDSNGSYSESTSSDQSWRMGGGRRGCRSKRTKLRRGGRGSKRRSKHRRSGGGRSRGGRRIPRFEGPSSDDDEIPVRRSARVRINYREIDSSEEEEEGVEVKKKRRSSESEYAPSQEEGEQGEEKSASASGVEEDQSSQFEEMKKRKPLPPVPPIQTNTAPEIHEIPQAITTDFPLPAELELDESELQIDEELMKGDDAIFQELLMGDINLPICQEPPGPEGDPMEGPP
ncbi:unnamed protein product [Hymenolepis diminuta]|nr:unnamed protein product [Hymenolepis diminuta]